MLRLLRRRSFGLNLSVVSSAASFSLLLFGAMLMASAPMLVLAQESPITGQAPAAPLFTLQEVMIPVRDGVHLQTAILDARQSDWAAADSFPAHALRSAGQAVHEDAAAY